MNRITLAVLGALASASTSNAADLSAAPVEPLTAAHDWSGFFAGVQLGYGWADIDILNTDLADAPDVASGESYPTIDADGIIGGGHLGFNWMAGAFVFGLEAAASATDISTTYLSDIGAADDEIEIDLEYIVTASGRIGYAFDNALVYIKGGYAGAESEIGFFDAGDFNPAGSDDNWLHGFNVGAGAALALTDSIIVGLEYSYIDLNGDFDFVEPGPDPINFDTDVEIHSVTARLSYQF